MKQRITYLLPRGTGLDRSDIAVTHNSLQFAKAAQAAQEWRLTLDLDELPDELRLILKHVQALHMKWSSPLDHDRVLPLVARTPPGFHASFTPRSGDDDVPLCTLFRILLDSNDIKCDSVATSFSRPQLMSQRTPISSSLQFFTNASPGRKLGDVILSKLCLTDRSLDACDAQIHELAHAAYIDVDYDAMDSVVSLTAYWSALSRLSGRYVTQRAKRPIRKVGADHRLEVGVLQVEDSDEAEKISLGGYLTVLGEDERPGATLFSFPSRHHTLPSINSTTSTTTTAPPAQEISPSSFKASFQSPTGLHPKLTLTFPLQSLQPPRPGRCALQAYLTLPSALFLDQYQISDQALLRSQNLLALHSLSGATDLEAPDWVVPTWGSAALFQLAYPAASQLRSSADSSGAGAGTGTGEEWNVTIPMHLRYVNGSSQSSADGQSAYATVQAPWPAVFWACESEAGFDFNAETNPFDRKDLGYDTFFSPKTVFYHVPPAVTAAENAQARGRLVEDIRVPVLDPRQAEWVPLGTLIVVGIGFAWVCHQLLTALGGKGGNGEKGSKRD